VIGQKTALLSFDEREKPLALQLGGSDPAKLAAAAQMGESAG
jgi:tRNA-dihydrouridine synthase A